MLNVVERMSSLITWKTGRKARRHVKELSLQMIGRKCFCLRNLYKQDCCLMLISSSFSSQKDSSMFSHTDSCRMSLANLGHQRDKEGQTIQLLSSSEIMTYQLLHSDTLLHLLGAMLADGAKGKNGTKRAKTREKSLTKSNKVALYIKLWQYKCC